MDMLAGAHSALEAVVDAAGRVCLVRGDQNDRELIDVLPALRRSCVLRYRYAVANRFVRCLKPQMADVQPNIGTHDPMNGRGVLLDSP